MLNTYSSFIYVNGTWKRVKPIILDVTNMGKIPSNALITSKGVPFLTKSEEYFLVDPSTPGLTAESADDYMYQKNLRYTAKIF